MVKYYVPDNTVVAVPSASVRGKKYAVLYDRAEGRAIACTCEGSQRGHRCRHQRAVESSPDQYIATAYIRQHPSRWFLRRGIREDGVHPITNVPPWIHEKAGR